MLRQPDRKPRPAGPLRGAGAAVGPGDAAEELATPTIAPRLTTWYRRASMTAESGAAADHARRAADVLPAADRRRGRRGGGAQPGRRHRAGTGAILEIKYWGDRPAWLARALDGLEPAHGFSKFKMGMAAITGSWSRWSARSAPLGVDIDVDVGVDERDR